MSYRVGVVSEFTRTWVPFYVRALEAVRVKALLQSAMYGMERKRRFTKHLAKYRVEEQGKRHNLCRFT